MTTVRLQSLNAGSGKMSINTPGLIRWAQDGWDGKNVELVAALAESFGVKQAVMLSLLTGEVDFTVEGEDVVFDWPEDSPMTEEEHE